jgi:5-methylthioadenosine/S-adenosylhomocysteine deaminase
VTLFIQRATYLLHDVRRIERDVDLLVEGNRIAAIGNGLPVPPDADTIDAQGCVVIPGLINTHTHLYQNFLKGVGAGMSLIPWCEAVLFPTVDVISEDHHAGNQRPSYLWSTLGALEMVRAGTTCCQNQDVGSSALPGVLHAWRDIGLRGVGAINMANRFGLLPPDLVPDEQKSRQGAERLIEQEHDPDSLVQIALGPSTPLLCDEGLLRWICETAEAYDLGIHMHVSETAEEVEEGLQEWGIRPVEWLDKIQMLSERFTAVHCVHIDEAEIELLARRGVTVVHCPKSNMKLADGVMPWPALKAAGVEVAIGNDGCGSNDLLDMWEDMRAAVMLAAVTTDNPAAITPADVFRAATEGGARSCRVDAGVLDPGRLADITVVDLSGPHVRPVHNILNTLIFCVRAADVRDVIIDGQVVMRQRRITTVDEAALVEEADAVGQEMYARRECTRY